MNMPENLYLEFDAFLRSIKQNLDGSFGVLLGAGASISSGIQSANDCIWDWKFLIYQSLLLYYVYQFLFHSENQELLAILYLSVFRLPINMPI